LEEKDGLSSSSIIINIITYFTSSVVSNVSISGNLSLHSSKNSNFINDCTAQNILRGISPDYLRLGMLGSMDAPLNIYALLASVKLSTSYHIVGAKQITRLR